MEFVIALVFSVTSFVIRTCRIRVTLSSIIKILHIMPSFEAKKINTKKNIHFCCCYLFIICHSIALALTKYNMYIFENIYKIA